MTVSTEISSNEYTGNGVTTDFDYKFRIFKANQLSVITSDADGDNVVTLRLGTDYTVTGANKSAGGKVILTRPLANGHKISIARDIPITQETSFRNQSKFFAETHEDAFDYLIMIIQRIWGSLGSLYLKRPNILANWFDAKGYRIANLGKPKRDSDAVDLGTLKGEIEGVNGTILKKEKRTLRVDDMDISAFPKASERRNKQIGFDNSGVPILLDPSETGSLGYVPVDSFEKGAIITGRYQALFWEEKGAYFRWDGDLSQPKKVNQNSTPDSTGGIGIGAWVMVNNIDMNKFISNYLVGSAVANKGIINAGDVEVGYTLAVVDNLSYNLEIYYGKEIEIQQDGKLRTAKESIRELYNDIPSGAVFNASAFVNDEDGIHAYPIGLQIANGVAYQDFGKTSQNQYDNKSSILIMKDGSLRLALASDNKTAQDYVNEGAWLSLGWHLVSIWDGKIYQPSTDPNRSARTVFGRINSKEYAIFQSEGASGKFGLTSNELENLLLSMGFTEAVQLDSGGSVQSVWNNSDLIKSSDLTPRKIGGGVLAVKCSTRDTAEYSESLINYIADTYGISKNAISHPRYGMSLSGIQAIYDPKENRIWMIPPLNGTLVSFNPPNITTTLTTQSLGGHNANLLNFFKNKAYTFSSGFTLKYANETIVHNGTEYRWGGALPKSFTAADNPDDSPTNWINVGSNSVVSQNAGTSKAVVMSQDAVTKLVNGNGLIDVTDSRFVNAEYSNSSTRIRTLLIQGAFSANNAEIKISVNDIDIYNYSGNSGTGVKINVPIPPFSKYKLTIVNGNFTISKWVEYQQYPLIGFLFIFLCCSIIVISQHGATHE